MNVYGEKVIVLLRKEEIKIDDLEQ